MKALALLFILTTVGSVWHAFALCIAIAQVWEWVCEITGGEESYTL